MYAERKLWLSNSPLEKGNQTHKVTSNVYLEMHNLNWIAYHGQDRTVCSSRNCAWCRLYLMWSVMSWHAMTCICCPLLTGEEAVVVCMMESNLWKFYFIKI
jgi:hypothetical protein